MSSMPKTITGANILCYSEYSETKNIIDFGGITNKLCYDGFSRFASKSIETRLTNVSQLIPRLLNSHVFYFIAFTLLSGQTLIIKTEEFASTKSFAEKLTILCPFYKPSHMKITNSINVVDSQQYSIVITKDVVGDVKKVVSLLDLITGYYNGDGCPSSSFVNNVLIDKDKQNLSENTFMLHILTKLKEISSKFMFFMRKFVNYSQTPDELLNAVQSLGISKDDVPILKYWICCYYNKSNLKPILRANHSKSGLTMTPF
ncbi:hypothetical protein TVAG_366920 [Trichomonas vaginalis G3]|uniref:UDENN FLCN/SMCR8-type domain-containing protein n=1 Tax=Trichomonas vaginalis (strain ATCC PRA-98 / G3) TaxID=412133 RepID=A2FZ78_TRIV3|nr:hypothetical protein TVAGG3_0003330 [Trichomonas vaginalis G3]EAX89788.1 hypothetical protein TVAG_366920 [Trichomonas vaginalis G3]KAI5538759.1 hypothetical protein TVAGG3_0003330 [Trichomonas vaginalis G3]|eukprot:XP_001302718.1 hypothetical protein [Trichomonas vaginalis G3]